MPFVTNLPGILLEAGILTISDLVGAIASHRCCRPAKGIKTILEEIKRNRGIFYEAIVVNGCLILF